MARLDVCCVADNNSRGCPNKSKLSNIFMIFINSQIFTSALDDDDSNIAAGKWFYLQSRDFLARIFLGVKRNPEEGKPDKPKKTDGKL